MKASEGKALKPGAIVQVNFAAGMDVAGRLGVIVSPSSWGASVLFFPAGVWSIAWSNMEATGGRAVWDDDGSPYPPEEKAK